MAEGANAVRNSAVTGAAGSIQRRRQALVYVDDHLCRVHDLDRSVVVAYPQRQPLRVKGLAM